MLRGHRAVQIHHHLPGHLLFVLSLAERKIAWLLSDVGKVTPSPEKGPLPMAPEPALPGG
jgi:hypothetical protein